MNKFALVLTLATFALGQSTTTKADTPEVSAASSECLYCRRMDKNAGFLVSYSYCLQLDECLMDAWNYINRPCLDEWKRGDSYDLTMCQPDNITCPAFVSDQTKYGAYTNTTWSLAAGGMCTVSIDATKGVARVIFDETSFLGIESGARIGDIITFQSGVNEIVIYNAAETGPLTFLISFSGAAARLGAAIAAVTFATLF